MKFEGLKKIGSNISSAMDKNAPTILTIAAVVGVVATSVMTAKAAPKAKEILDDIHEREEEQGEKIPAAEKIKEVAPVIAPPMLMGAATVACIVGSNVAAAKKIEGLTTAYGIAKEALSNYEAATKEVVGEKKALDVKDTAQKKLVENNPPSKAGNDIYITGRGNVLCYDPYSGRYYRSNFESIRKSVNDLNYRMRDEMWVTLNDLYDELGLPQIKVGESLGWNINCGNIEIQHTAMVTENDEPCLVIDFYNKPDSKYDY